MSNIPTQKILILIRSHLKAVFQQIIDVFRTNTPLTAFCLFLLSSLVFLTTQATLNLPDPDAFYHLKIAEFLAHGTLIRDFPYAAFTVLTQYYYDQHFLYHIFLIPFTFIPQPFVGLKVATMLLGGGAVTAFYFLLRSFRAQVPALWTFLLLISGPLIFRMSLPKAISTSLIFLFIGITLAREGKYLLMYVWSTLYVWAYGGFFILGVLIGILIFTEILSNKKLTAKNIRIITAMVLGFATGLIINPYFPNNIFYIWDQLVQIGILNYQNKIGVGGEWYPYKIGDVLYDTWLISFLFCINIIVFIKTIKKQNVFSKSAFVWALFFIFFTLKSRRYIEYAIPFSILSTALTCTQLTHHLTKTQLKKYLLTLLRLPITTILLIFIPVTYLLFFSIATSINTFTTTVRDSHSGEVYNTFSKSMTWLKANGEHNTIVFHSDWDEFPELFYYNSNNFYIVGLDATFMYKYSPTLHQEWVDITTGKTQKKVYNIIHNDFGARYVFITKDHTAMRRNITLSPGFQQIYEDDEAVIFEVTPSK